MLFVQIVLFFHVLAAVWMSAGILGSLLVVGRLRSSVEPPAAQLAVDLLSRLHRLYTLPGMIVAGLLGISLVTATGYRFTQLWIAAAAFLFVVLFHLSLFGITPRIAALRKSSRVRNDAMPPSTQDLISQTGWRYLLHLQAILLVALLLLMTAKP